MYKLSHPTNHLGDFLLQGKLIQPHSLNQAIQEHHLSGKNLADILVERKYFQWDDLLPILSQISGYPIVSLETTYIDPACLELIPFNMAQQGELCCFEIDHLTLKIAMVDPENVLVKDQLLDTLKGNWTLLPYHTSPEALQNMWKKYSEGNLFGPSKKDSLGEPKPHSDFNLPKRIESTLVSENVTTEVDEILQEAVEREASDIHFHPMSQEVMVKFRMDGFLGNIKEIPKDRWEALCVRLKILAALNIAENRRPQSGRFDKIVHRRSIDFRLSTHPSNNGENIVVRLLDKEKSLKNLDELGFLSDQMNYLRRLVNHTQGLVVITGPTGSGKTTTLYALLSYMNALEKNIMTLEDPVEYLISGIRQTQVHPSTLTYAQGLRSILRQDPDIIFVGEIRDEETAQMALRAALTGHLVLTTLHTSDVFSVPHRLMDLGVSPALISDSLISVISQRLVRRLCPVCKIQNLRSFQPVGCNTCYQVGYKGRFAIAQILPINPDIREAITAGHKASDLENIAQKHNIPAFLEIAKKKIESGETSLQELEEYQCPILE